MSKSGLASKKISRRDFLKTAGAAGGAMYLLAIAPAGAFAQSNAKLRIMWWGPQARHDATIAALELFEERYPNIEIEYEFLSFDAYNEKLATQLAGGNAADIFQLPLERYGEYATRGVLMALDDSNPHPVDLTTFDQSMMSSLTLDGKVYGIPTGINSGALFVALDVFEEVGIAIPDYTWTWDDFAVIANQISEAKGDDFWGTMDGGGHREAVSSYMRGIGKSTFDADGKLGFSKDDLATWFAYWDDLRKSGGAVPAEVMATFQERLEMHMIIQDKAAMDFSGASLGLSLQSVTPHDLGILTLPSGPVSLGQSTISGNLWTIYAKTDHPAEVGQLADFLVNDPEAGAILGQVRGVPASSVVQAVLQENAEPIDQKMFAFFELLAQHGSPPAPPIPPGGGEVITGIIPRANEAIAFGQLSIDKAVDRVFQESERALDV